MLKHNGSNIVTILHDFFVDTTTITLSLGNFYGYVAGTYASLVYNYRLDLWLHLVDHGNTVDAP